MRVCSDAWLNHGVFSEDMIQDGLAQGNLYEVLDDGMLTFDSAKRARFIDWASRAGVPLSGLQTGIQAEFTP
jgi:hypothetical protein